MTPKLSICVPSRNRQYYFQKTIEGLCRNGRDDVEFVFADNSDDPSIMNDYMVPLLARDRRIVFLPSEGRTLSMIENWERTLAATSGDWVTVIGDDDYCEPDVVDVIDRCRNQLPDLEAFGWSCIPYTWPMPDLPSHNVNIPLQSSVYQLTQALCFDRMFRWVGADSVPCAGFSVYHAAISRGLLEAIRRRYASTYFEHPTVDYDMAMKVIHTGRRFAYSSRPFSVMGSCPQSNSFAIKRPDDAAKKIRIFNSETGRDIGQDEQVRDFPFKMHHGISASIAMTQHWFKTRYKVAARDWEVNFVKACARNTEIFGDLDQFEQSRATYTEVLRAWHGGRYLEHYRPERKPSEQRLAVTGFLDGSVYINPAATKVENPAQLFDLVNAMTCPVDLLEIDLTNPVNLGISEAEAGLARRRA